MSGKFAYLGFGVYELVGHRSYLKDGVISRLLLINMIETTDKIYCGKSLPNENKRGVKLNIIK